MRAISEEKRALIVEAKIRGEKETDIAKWLQISRSVVNKIWLQYQEKNTYKAKPYPGRKPTISEEKKQEIFRFVDKNPDKTLNEIVEELKLPIGRSQLSRILIREGYSFKKKRHIPPNETLKKHKKSVKNLRKN